MKRLLTPHRRRAEPRKRGRPAGRSSDDGVVADRETLLTGGLVTMPTRGIRMQARERERLAERQAALERVRVVSPAVRVIPHLRRTQ